MFEIPGVIPQDREVTSSYNRARGVIRQLEVEEVKKGKKTDFTYIEPITFRGEPHYIGLVSHGIFDQEGNLVGDVITKIYRETAGFKHITKQVVPPTRLNSNETEIYENVLRSECNIGNDTLGPKVIAFKNQQYILPRNTCRPRVGMDQALTQQFVRTNTSISEKTRQILMRSNYRAPFTLQYCTSEDRYENSPFLRRRSLQVATSLLFINLERRDYERAYKILSVLFREPFIDVELIWMPALELLAWRYAEGLTKKTPFEFLDWLIANFPDSYYRKIRNGRYMAKASDFIPIRLMLMISSNDMKAALEEGEQVCSSATFKNNALCWVMCGIANLLSDRTKRAQYCFKKCVELGGVLPLSLRRVANNSIHSDSESSDEEQQLEFDSVDSDSGPGSGSEDSEDSDIELKEQDSEDVLEESMAQGDDHESEEEPEEDEEDPNKILLKSESNSESDIKVESPSDSNDSEDKMLPGESSSHDALDSLPAKSPEVSESDSESASESPSKRRKLEIGSSQPFYSQDVIGAEWGSSESDLDI